LNTYPTSTSIKINLGPPSAAILQFEYSLWSNDLFYDLSDIDGTAPGIVGSPFYNENVKLTPTGNNAGVDVCVEIVCPMGSLCEEAYNESADVATKVGYPAWAVGAFEIGVYEVDC
jgi:hypothetical protein